VHVRPEAVSGTRVVLDAEEARHLRRVLRLRVGDLVRALDGRGRELTVRLTALGSRSAEGQILDSTTPARESPLHLTLAQGLPKADKLDTIIRMCTELGVAAVVPLLTSRAVPVGAGRLARWERVAREAAKQSGRAVVPAISAPLSLGAWLAAREPTGLLVCLWERETSPLADRLPVARPAHAVVVVGPEGGLADEEVGSLEAAGAVVAGLGPRVLRTETAGPVAVALLQARWGDLGACAPRESG
jgi:16S rRNA (uracil1498-N3)-methyltransferase